MEYTVCLRKNYTNVSREMGAKSWRKIMWVQKGRAYIKRPKNTWNEQAPSLCRLAINDRPLQVSEPSSLEKLWRPRGKSKQSVGIKLREFLGRYEARLSARANTRPNRPERRLHTGELSLGNLQTTSTKQTGKSDYNHSLGGNNSSGSSRNLPHRSNNITLPTNRGGSRKRFVHGPGFTESVYDLLNVGAKNRFVVLGDTGPFIVHNCVQGLARDCLTEAMVRLDTAGYRATLHVHDEVVIEVQEDRDCLEDICRIMSERLPWAPDLPLPVDGYETPYYRKD